MRAVLLTAAVAALALAGCAETNSVIAPLTRNTVTEDPARYADLAAAGTLFDLQSAQLALTRAQSEDVRVYAQRMIDRNPISAQTLSAAATADGVTLPAATLTAAQQRKLAELESAPAERFDAVYLRQQLPVQLDAVELHEAFALAGETPQLRHAAAQEVGQAHQFYQDVRRMQRSRG